MDTVFVDILRQWEDRVADPAIYEHLDTLFPGYSFRRVNPGGPRDHWASRLKLDLTLPRHKIAEKTVVYRSEMRFREQGEWAGGIKVMDKLIQDNGLSSIYEAYALVSRKLVLDMPQPDSREVREALSRASRRESLLETLLDYFCWNIQNNPSAKAREVRKYLKNVRGFTDDDITRFCLGFVPDWSKVVRYITIDKQYRLEELDEVCGVRNEEGYTAVGKTHTLAIPYICGGKVKGFLFRRLDDSRPGPKYIATAGLERKRVFFNMPEKLSSGALVVVEGEMDALKATSAGIQNVVAIGGSEIAGERRLQLEDAFRRGVERIILCLDLDSEKDSEAPNLEARHGHIMKSIHTIKDVAPAFEEIFVASFQEPSDPDQFIRERGGEDFKELLKEAKPYWRYLFDYKECKLTL